jgi:hypothetical protein
MMVLLGPGGSFAAEALAANSAAAHIDALRQE